MTAAQNLQTMAGIDASRRVGWARYFDEVEDREAAERSAGAWLAVAVRLAVDVRYHDRLPGDDPLVVMADSLLAALEATPEGRRLVERTKQRARTAPAASMSAGGVTSRGRRRPSQSDAGSDQ